MVSNFNVSNALVHRVTMILPAHAPRCFTLRGDSIQELAFLDLKYEVENIRPGMEAEILTVLDGVSGQANSREILALVRALFISGARDMYGTTTA